MKSEHTIEEIQAKLKEWAEEVRLKKQAQKYGGQFAQNPDYFVETVKTLFS